VIARSAFAHRTSSKLRLLPLLLATLTTACEEGVTEPEIINVTLAVAGPTNVVLLPLSVMQAKGFFAEEGLNVTILATASSADTRTAFISGAADVAMSNYEQLLSTRTSGGTDAVSFVLFGNTPGPALAVRFSLAGSIKTAKDLSGRKVGISSPSSPSHNLVRYLLRKEGVAESAVTFVSVGLGEPAEAALESGQIDALSSVDPAITDLQIRGTGQVISDTRTLVGTRAVYGGDYTGATLYARRTFIEQHPEATQRLTNAAMKALRWMAASTPEQIVAALSDAQVNGQRDLYVQMLRNSPGMFSTDGLLVEATLNRVIATAGLFDPSIAAAGIMVGDTYTNVFVNRVR
jgi:NitT/TauT family transport system substrate-binding protein